MTRKVIEALLAYAVLLGFFGWLIVRNTPATAPHSHHERSEIARKVRHEASR